MGGWNSGRSGGRPIAENCFRVDFGWMLRQRLAVPGQHKNGTLNWTCGGLPSGSIGYEVDMVDPYFSRLVLIHRRNTGENAKSVRQEIPLTFTVPHYGGRRWWMICPYRGHRVSILYLPGNGDRFASRKAWRVGYKIQRVTGRDKAFEALFKIQRRLGCDEGWEMPIRRPKGMWHRTYAPLEDRFYHLNDVCAVQMMMALGVINGRLDSAKK